MLTSVLILNVLICFELIDIHNRVKKVERLVRNDHAL